LHSNQKLVNPGDEITLTWNAENTTLLKLGDRVLTSSTGTITEIINENTEFILHGNNSYLSVEIKLFIRLFESQNEY
jgi:preprotein translocase subunit YajC